MRKNNIHPEDSVISEDIIRHKSVHLPELLAPAGSLAHLKGAVLAGADAVYIGGRMFSARAYAENLEDDGIEEALLFTHIHGRRLYLTVNTLMKDEELNKDLYGFLRPYYEAGLDGVIVQDLGTASFIHRNFPGMEIHASTQMTITHAQGALAAGRLGMTRVVPARELSLPELITIKKESGLEIEVFIHGALCYCYSGQCLLSSYYQDRSGNRGRCAQPCRLAYEDADGNKACYLSMRDLCSLHDLPRLCDAGIDSLKIEGRMKNIDYVAGVTAIYRKYLDLYARLHQEGHPESYRVSPEDFHHLEELYCRGGFTDGYLDRHNGSSMMAVRTQKNLGRKIGEIESVDRKRRRIHVRLTDTLYPKDILVIPSGQDQETVLTVPGSTGDGRRIILNIPEGSSVKKGMPVYRRKNEALSGQIRKEILDRTLKYPVDVIVRIGKDMPSEVTLTSRDVSITIEGPAACQAQKRAISREDIEKQFRKTGETPFELSCLKLFLDEGCFMPLSELKQLRQDGYRMLGRKLAAAGTVRQDGAGRDTIRPVVDGPQPDRLDAAGPGTIGKTAPGAGAPYKERIALVYDQEILEACLSFDFYTAICLPADTFSLDELRIWNYVIKEKGKKALLSLPVIMRHGKDDFEAFCKGLSWDGIYVHNMNEAAWLAANKDHTGKRIAASSFYQWNTESLRTSVITFGIDAFQLPVELRPQEWEPLIKAAGQVEAEAVVYGRIPLMVSAQCLNMTRGRCNPGGGILRLRDPRGRILPVSTHCAYCYNRIWSHEPVDLKDIIPESLAAAIPGTAFDFFGADPSLPGLIRKKWIET